MLVVEDVDFEDAIRALRKAEFSYWPWSFGSRSPDFYKGPMKERIYQSILRDYKSLDEHSARFLLKKNLASETKIVLVPASYAHITVKGDSNETLIDDSNIYLPTAARLVRSFVQTLLREPIDGMWTSTLEMWTISYLYGELMLDDDILDSCDDADAKSWFNENIRRFSGGLDRVTCTKRLGRVGYDESLAKVP